MGRVTGNASATYRTWLIVLCAVAPVCVSPVCSYVARNAPILVLPNINHGSTSNGIARPVRGDITAGVAPYEECIQVRARDLGEL